ncbi:MAG: DUF2840 domain-containing protein [Sphingobium sp.]
MRSVFTDAALMHQPEMADDRLCFGDPAETRTLSPRRSIASFVPGAIFAYIRWRGGEHGTTSWRLWVLCAAAPGERIQSIDGITPGAHILLAVAGPPKVRQVLALIDAIERAGFSPADVAASWWRVAHNRIAANRTVRPYGLDEHRADLVRRRIAP